MGGGQCYSTYIDIATDIDSSARRHDGLILKELGYNKFHE